MEIEDGLGVIAVTETMEQETQVLKINLYSLRAREELAGPEERGEAAGGQGTTRQVFEGEGTFRQDTINTLVRPVHVHTGPMVRHAVLATLHVLSPARPGGAGIARATRKVEVVWSLGKWEWGG